MSSSGSCQLGKEPCHAETSRSWTLRPDITDGGGDLPPEAGLWAKPHHCSQAVLKLLFNIPLFLQASHLFRAKHRSGWKKLLGQLSSVIVSPSLGTSLSFDGTSLPKCFQTLLPHYFQECPETLSQAQNCLQASPHPPWFKWKLTFSKETTASPTLWSRTCLFSLCCQLPSGSCFQAGSPCFLF